MKHWILTLTAILFGTQYLAAGPLSFNEADRLVVQSQGRKKPFDTFARETIKGISGRATLQENYVGRDMGSTDAVFSIWLQTRDWMNLPVILVSNARLAKSLDVPPTKKYFSFNELIDNPRLQSIYKRIEAKRRQNRELDELETKMNTVLNRMRRLKSIWSGDGVTIVPDPSKKEGTWVPIDKARRYYDKEAQLGLEKRFESLGRAYKQSDQAAFSKNSRELRTTLASLAPQSYPADGMVELEIHYNQFHPFRWAWLLYLGGFFATVFGVQRKWGLALFGAGVLMHSYGFALRCWISGRAPVTNMYESLVWVSLGVAFFAFYFSWRYRTTIYLTVAGPLTVGALIFSDMLPAALDSSIDPLPPVLKSNFWLTTHVLTITLGYAALALAGALAHAILGIYLFKPGWIGEKSSYHQLLYRALQAGILLLAVGIVLGGVWANYSWGRFWGWDPKETWSLIALLLYLFALHGRLARWWGNFGLSASAALCFHGVLMAWYGVNFVLASGLHSYGFGGGGALWIGGLVGLDILFVGICILVRSRQLRTRTVPTQLDEVTTDGAKAEVSP